MYIIGISTGFISEPITPQTTRCQVEHSSSVGSFYLSWCLSSGNWEWFSGSCKRSEGKSTQFSANEVVWRVERRVVNVTISRPSRIARGADIQASSILRMAESWRHLESFACWRWNSRLFWKLEEIETFRDSGATQISVNHVVSSSLSNAMGSFGFVFLSSIPSFLKSKWWVTGYAWLLSLVTILAPSY